MSTFTILVVCVGNVCRSPMAERLLSSHIEALRGSTDSIQISSAGVSALAGNPMNEMTAAQLQRLGVSASEFTAVQLETHMVEQADLTLVATRPLRSSVLEEVPRALQRTFTIREFSALTSSEAMPTHDHDMAVEMVRRASSLRGSVTIPDYDVPDPIGRSTEFHSKVADLLNAECAAISRVFA